MSATGLQKSLKKGFKTGVEKQVGCHTFRHSFATHLLQNAYDIRTVQELLEYKDVKTTMIYTHVLNQGGKGVLSPLDSRNIAILNLTNSQNSSRGDRVFELAVKLTTAH